MHRHQYGPCLAFLLPTYTNRHAWRLAHQQKKKKLIHKNHANIRKVHTPQKPARECRGIFRVLPGALPAASFISRLSLRCSSPGGDQIQIDVGSGGQAGGLASCGALRIRGFKHLEQSWTHALGTSYCWEIAWDIVGSINTNR